MMCLSVRVPKGTDMTQRGIKKNPDEADKDTLHYSWAGVKMLKLV